MRFITKHQDITYTLKASVRSREGGFTEHSKPIRAHFKGQGQGEFDSDIAARRFNWTDEEKRFAEEALLRHFDFNAPSGGFWLEPGQDLPEWALELVGEEVAVDLMKAAGEGCQFVYVTESEKAEACSQLAISPEVPYCLRHALENGYEVSVTKPEDAQNQAGPAPAGRTRPRTKEAATA